MNLLLAVPTYGPVESQASRHLRTAMMHATNRGGVRWVGDVSPNRMAFHTARTTAVRLALESPDAAVQSADAILWVDADVVLPVDGITRLVAADKDFVTGLYVQREPPYFPLIAHYDRTVDTFRWFIDFPENVLAPVDGCGFGCVLTSVRMLRAMGAPWFTADGFSEDFAFCRRAADAGFQLFVDTGVRCGHLRDPLPATYEDFVAIRDRGGLDAFLPHLVPESAA